MKQATILIAAIIWLCFSGYAQTSKVRGKAANGDYIGFLQFLPDSYESSATKFPLIIFLHGIGEKGNGTTELDKLKCCGIPDYINRGSSMTFSWQGKSESFIVLSPQLDKKYFLWQDFYVDELIQYALQNLKVDPDRIFLTGLSLGGGGTWSYASGSMAKASRLAGIVPVVAPCLMKTACNIAKAGLPVFTIAAMDDTIAPVQCTVNNVRLINNCSPLVSPNVVLYQSGGHHVFFNKAYDTTHKYQNPNIFEWMLAQNGKLPPNKKPVAKLSATSSITSDKGLIVLDGRKSFDPDGQLVDCSWERIGGPQPGTFTVLSPGVAELSDLTTPGIYKFAIKVVDDRAEWDTDTVAITLSTSTTINLPPIAQAGETISVQAGQAVVLDGSDSKDPDGTIVSYVWSYLSGSAVPVTFSSANMRTTIPGLQAGIYQFKLYVVDNKGAIATDVVEVNVFGRPDDATVSGQPANTLHAGPVKSFVFPNPVRGNAFSIRVPQTVPVRGVATIEIYGLAGELYRTIRTSNLNNINVGGLQRGTYLIKIIFADKQTFNLCLIRQ